MRRFLSTIASSSVDATAHRILAPTYSANGVRTLPNLLFTHGKGCELHAEGHDTPFLDFGAGIAVSILGHGNKDVSEAIYQQSKKLNHVSNLYHTSKPLIVASKLLQLSPGFSKVFFTNSGTESNEAAIKFAALSNPSKSKVLAFKGSFHGRSLGSLRATYKPKIRKHFLPLIDPNEETIFLDLNDTDSLIETFENHGSELLLSIVEPVQGEGGVNPCSEKFLTTLRQLCTKHSVPLIMDEVQTGLGRCGSSWAHQTYGVVPDILTCAKPLAAGLPMGAVLVSNEFAEKLGPDKLVGEHGTTFGGNPVCAAAAEVVLDSLLDQRFLPKAKEVGRVFTSLMVELGEKFPALIKRINRPLGDDSLYAGIALTGCTSAQVIQGALKRNLVVLSAGDNNDIVRICPPLIISKEHVVHGAKILTQVFQEIEQQKSLEASSILPEGFQSSSCAFEFTPAELGEGALAKMTTNLVKLDDPTTSYAAVFTQNKFCGAPVTVGRELVADNTPIQAILVNNKISNVHPKDGGLGDIAELSDALKSLIPELSGAVFPSSTGVIGWRLPVSEMKKNLPNNVAALSADNGASFAEGIMTTDRYAKSESVEVMVEGEFTGRVTGFAKGAGMVMPNMATMLVFILTDVDTTSFKERLQSKLHRAVNAPGSFNRISIDSDTSTSDTMLLLSTDKQKTSKVGVESQFDAALLHICKYLAEEVVRNGEGVEHVIRVAVSDARDQQEAIAVGRQVVNSPLVKTAIAGNDPNVGRILGAIGTYFSHTDDLDKNLLEIDIGSERVFQDGEFDLDSTKETTLSVYMRTARVVDIKVRLGRGEEYTEILGADLTEGYVQENATYRS